MADVFDALTHGRPYKTASTVDGAVKYIKDQFGKHFDPDAAEAFLQTLDRGLLRGEERKERT